jgi:hypothetical protein
MDEDTNRERWREGETEKETAMAPCLSIALLTVTPSCNTTLSR